MINALPSLNQPFEYSLESEKSDDDVIAELFAQDDYSNLMSEFVIKFHDKAEDDWFLYISGINCCIHTTIVSESVGFGIQNSKHFIKGENITSEMKSSLHLCVLLQFIQNELSIPILYFADIDRKGSYEGNSFFQQKQVVLFNDIFKFKVHFIEVLQSDIDHCFLITMIDLIFTLFICE